MRFKVGDKVRVRKLEDLVKEYPETPFGLRVGEVGSDGILREMEMTEDMLRFCGKIVTISKVSSHYYNIEEDEAYWSWTDEMLENQNADDLVNNPSHYTYGEYEVIDVIEDWKLNYRLGNAIKYIARCEHKGNKKQDLEKAIWYLRREIEKGD